MRRVRRPDWPWLDRLLDDAIKMGSVACLMEECPKCGMPILNFNEPHDCRIKSNDTR